MQIAFRTDASLHIGTGHVMRCLTLAHALRERGAICRFICRLHSGNLNARIRQQGFEVIDLPTRSDAVINTDSCSSWLGASQEEDAADTVAAFAEKTDWIIVDHYAIDARWESRVHPSCARLMVIDDLANRDHHCELLLDQNLGRLPADYAARVPSACTVLTGPQHALLRPEFAAARVQRVNKKPVNTVRQLLISMGGVDLDNVTTSVLQALKNLALAADCHIVIVMGQHAPGLQSVRDTAATLAWTNEIIVDANNIAELMAASDLAIGAAGGSAWERCCTGLPTILLTLADNQIAGASALDAAGCAKWVKNWTQDSDEFRLAIEAWLEPDALHSASKACLKTTDGEGATRLASLIYSQSQHDGILRPMQLADLDQVRAWRNAPDIRQHMCNTHEISAAEHQAWFERTTNDPDKALLIFESASRPLGFVQFAGIANSQATEWGFYAAPDAPKGTGSKLGKAALEHAFTNLKISTVTGRAKPSNGASIAFHQKLGFIRDASDYDESFISFAMPIERWQNLRENQYA